MDEQAKKADGYKVRLLSFEQHKDISEKGGKPKKDSVEIMVAKLSNGDPLRYRELMRLTRDKFFLLHYASYGDK